MHYITLLLANSYAFTLDPAEQGPEEPSKPAQAEKTNPEQDQGKPQCI
jgi:hypothetical protein